MKEMIDKEAKIWDRSAKKYFDDVVSPFAEGVKNPIFWYLDNKITGNTKEMSVIDIGCGIGNFLPIISIKFANVIGIDFSPKMIEYAQEKTKSYSNIQLLVRDARDLSEFHTKFDVAVSVNSVLLPKITDVEKILREANLVLKEGGTLLAVFPAMEAFLYRALLIQEKAMEDGTSEEEALKIARNDLQENTPCDFESGVVKYPDCQQKNYYLFELKYRLWKAGFTNIKVRKVHYPWEVYEDDTLLAFHDKQKLWDWFVYAKK